MSAIGPTPIPSATNECALSLRALTVRAPLGDPMLDCVSLDVPRGSIVAVLGASGAGKSTLFGAIAGLIPSEGSVVLGGRNISRDAPHTREIGIAFDDALLHEHLTVGANIDNARLPYSTQHRESPKARALAVHHIAEAMNITRLLARNAPTLSAGERRRCAIARALARQGAILLLDEPFANLDRPSRLALRATLSTVLCARVCTALIATHDIADAIAIGTHLAVLAHGQLRQFDTTRAVLARPSDSDVASLLGEDAPCVAPVSMEGRTLFLGVRPSAWCIASTESSAGTLSMPMRLHAVEPTAFGAECLATHVDHHRDDGLFRLRVSEELGRQLLRDGVCVAAVRENDVLVFGPSQASLWGAHPLLGSFDEVVRARV